MSHTVTVTRTTTTSSTSAILLNVGLFKTLPGLLKLAEIIIGAVIVGLVAHYINQHYAFTNQTPQLFMLLIATTFLIATFCNLLSCFVSIGTASILPKTIFELICHFFAFVLYLAASITFLIDVQNNKRNKYYYEPFLAASILGLINSGLYLISTVLSYKSYRGG